MQQKFTLLFFALLLSIAGATAQTVATFDTLTLPTTDTYYVNHNNTGTDVGFDDGLAHYPAFYDSSFGSVYWRNGFSYSNMRDTATRGYTNDHSAITVRGYDSSSQYLIAYGITNMIYLKGKAKGQPVNGFLITNTTYGYHTMNEGYFNAKKFGGVSGSDSDWYKVTIKGYSNGQMTADSVEVFLADFRSADSTQDTILNGWKWVNLLSLGNVDSLKFTLSSSDNDPMWGMNTPAYFAMDNFETWETSSVRNVPVIAAKVYPNPAVSNLFVEAMDNSFRKVMVVDAIGRTVAMQDVTGKITTIDVASWAPGLYILQLIGEGQIATMRFVKQ